MRRRFPALGKFHSAAASGTPTRAVSRRPRGHEKGRMNSTERKFFAEVVAPGMLAPHADTHERIVRADFERVTLRLTEPDGGTGERVVTWTPDFALLLASGLIVFVDVKGSQDNEAAQDVKIRVAADQYQMWFFCQAKLRPKKLGGGWAWRWFGGQPEDWHIAPS